ncbi:MAG TPA: sulfite exporter TauE/SafE family protein [Acidimicrobiales bacterium]|nr:sulfite exporter TauE/SafE family protein [Acidimicrobiales bacterium]
MGDLIVVALAGFLASIVDGALGMGFGPTSSSILLSSGISPAAASATVNLAKVATGLAAGISHWRFDNIDHRLVVKLAYPGAIGAVVGTTVLANVDGDDLRPVLAVLLLAVGLRILLRFSRDLPAAPEAVEGEAPSTVPPFDERGVEVAAGIGGVTNGLVGAWGPVVTPFLLHKGLPPRFAIGSTNTAEVVVAVVSSASLVLSLGGEGIRLSVVLAMLGGGVVAAPLAAYVVRFVPARLLGLAVAGLLLLTQTRELAGSVDAPGSRWLVYSAIPVAVAVAALRPRLRRR